MRMVTQRLVVLGFAVLVLFACSADGITEVASIEDPLLRDVMALGFAKEDIVDEGDYFVVEGDILIAKASLRQARETGAGESEPQSVTDTLSGLALQWRTSQLVAGDVVTAIRVDLSAMESSWRTAAREAMAEWNALTPGSMIRFVEQAPAQITVTMSETLGGNCSGTIAQALWPSNGQPGPTIQVSTRQTCLSSSAKRFTMAHEFGHTIGLRHTNLLAIGEGAGSIGAIHISGTPTSTDANSVMNNVVAQWAGFSGYDKLAGFMLYKPAAPAVNPTTYPGGVPFLSWSAMPDAPLYRVELYEYCNYIDENNEHWDCSPPLSYTEWSSATSASFAGKTYTGVSSCDFPGGGGGTYYMSASFALEIQYPIAVTYGIALIWRTIGEAEVLTC